MDNKSFEQIKARYAELQAEQSRIEGAKESVLAALKEDYGLNSLAAAKEKITALQKEQRTVTDEIDALFSKLTKLGI